MITEAEAKTKWCPLSRELSSEGGASFNRNGHGRIDCIGSACMAWRRVENIDHTDYGYCGAFGRAE